MGKAESKLGGSIIVLLIVIAVIWLLSSASVFVIVSAGRALVFLAVIGVAVWLAAKLLK